MIHNQKVVVRTENADGGYTALDCGTYCSGKSPRVLILANKEPTRSIQTCHVRGRLLEMVDENDVFIKSQ